MLGYFVISCRKKKKDIFNNSIIFDIFLLPKQVIAYKKDLLPTGGKSSNLLMGLDLPYSSV
jgi:hypothetical protein